jgi:hypothetical protein
VVLRLLRISSRFFQYLEPFKGGSQEEKERQVDVANCDRLGLKGFPLLDEDDLNEDTPFEVTTDLVIVFSKSLRALVSRGTEQSPQETCILTL